MNKAEIMKIKEHLKSLPNFTGSLNKEFVYLLITSTKSIFLKQDLSVHVINITFKIVIIFLAPTSEELYIAECLSVCLSVSLSVCLSEFLKSHFNAQYLSSWWSDWAEIWHTYQP